MEMEGRYQATPYTDREGDIGRAAAMLTCIAPSPGVCASSTTASCCCCCTHLRLSLCVCLCATSVLHRFVRKAQRRRWLHQAHTPFLGSGWVVVVEEAEKGSHLAPPPCPLHQPRRSQPQRTGAAAGWGWFRWASLHPKQWDAGEGSESGLYLLMELFPLSLAEGLAGKPTNFFPRACEHPRILELVGGCNYSLTARTGETGLEFWRGWWCGGW